MTDQPANAHAIRIFFAVNALNGWASGLIAPIMSVFVVQVGGDLRRAGELASVYLLASTLVGMWVTGRSMRLQRVLLLASLAALVPFYLMLLTVDGHRELYLIQLLLGLTSGVQWATTSTWMHFYVDHGQGAQVMQKNSTGRKFLATAGAFLGGYMSHHLGFDSVFIAMAVISAVAFVIAIGWLDRGHLRPDAARMAAETSSG